MSRYTDSYLVARTIAAFGATVKFIAFAIGVGIFLVALIAGHQSVEYGVGGFILGAIVAIPIYILGILVSAQGQILKATLDTAVCSSPLLTKDEMRQIMSLD
jgi:ABC-type antimicrobial peptide transport system permease subunit